jgi:quinol monooxygenase YgiN
MAKLVEMDENETVKDQMENEVAGPVILINKFNVDSNEVEQFLKAWQEDAIKFKQQSGFISAQLHYGIGKSTVFVNYAVWESFKMSFNTFRSSSDKSTLFFGLIFFNKRSALSEPKISFNLSFEFIPSQDSKTLITLSLVSGLRSLIAFSIIFL